MRLLAAALVALMSVAAAWADTPVLPGDAGAPDAGASTSIAGCIDASKRRDADAAIKLCSLALDTGHLDEAPMVAALVNRGLAHIARNEPAAAISDFDQAISIRPDSAAFYDMRALAHAMQGEGAPAVRDYAEVIRRGGREDASDFEKLLRQGITTHLDGDEVQAAQIFAQAARIANSGSDDEAKARLWEYLTLQASRQNALTPLNNAVVGRDLTAWPGPLVRYYQGSITEAALEGLLEDPDPAVSSARACDASFYVSAKALVDGRFSVAKDGFGHVQTLCAEGSILFTAARAEAIVAAEPVPDEIGNDMAQCQAAESNGDNAGMIDLCGKAEAHAEAPDVWRLGALTLRAQAYDRSGDLGRAIADVDAALTLRPDSFDLYRQRGLYRLGKGERIGGIADLTYALTLQPDFVPAMVDRAWARLSDADTTGALADFTRALQVQPDLPRLHLGRGVVAYLSGDDAQAAADFGAVIEATSQAPYAVLWLALTERRRPGAGGDALAGGLAALDLAQWPGPVIRFIRGEASTEELAAAVAGDPKQDCEAGFYSGAVAKISGDKAAAKTAFEHALTVCSPDNLEYHAAEAELHAD